MSPSDLLTDVWEGQELLPGNLLEGSSSGAASDSSNKTGELFLGTGKQETAKVVRSFVLHTSEQSKGAPQTEPTTTSRPQGPPSVASDRLLTS